MNYLSWTFYIFVLILALIYYIIPQKFKWYVLLVGSIYFYYALSGSLKTLFIFLVEILIGYFSGILIEKYGSCKYGRVLTAFLIALCIIPLICIKIRLNIIIRYSLIITVGISYYTLQMISYIADIYMKKISAQKNPLKYILYMSFFPQIVQGPIPRYKDLSTALFDGNKFEAENIIRGIELIIWGFFLKYMIADRASIVVDQVFTTYEELPGAVIGLGGILYSIQLYADFLACVTISQGIAEIFGIRLSDNFKRPYFAPSIRDFWRRWHMSLSFWLRDYIYIPLGGGKKGKIRRYINLIITFVISGFWHGNGLNYLAWGLLHAFYQIIGGFTWKTRNRIWDKTGLKSTSVPVRILRALGTSFLAMIAWILFRAENLTQGIRMIQLMFEKLEFEQIKNMGLVVKVGAFIGPREWYVLIISVFILLIISIIQSKIEIRSWLKGKPMILRGVAGAVLIMVVFVFGSYGYGFEAADFIYGGF